MALLKASYSEKSQAVSSGKRLRFSKYFFAFSVVFTLFAIAFRSFHPFRHSDHVLLLLQYVLVLWSLLWFLHLQHFAAKKHPQDLSTTLRLPDLNVSVLIGCFALLAIPLSWFASRGLVNPDESGYSFQARIYVSGRIVADPLIGVTPDVRQTPEELFYENHVLRPFGWFPKFPPGWPAVLSLGYLISAPWLPAAIFGALQLGIIASIGSLWFSHEVGALAVLYAALSPFYLVNSVGMMSHALCALLGAAAFLSLCRALDTKDLHFYAAMFACLAFAFQVRPYTAFVLTLVMTAASVWFIRNRPKLLWQVLSIGAVFGGLAIAGVLIYNHTYTGKWLVSPYAEAAGANTPPELSFNPIIILRAMARHGPFMLLETILGSYPFLHILAAYAILFENRYRRETRVLAVLYVALVFAYLFHPGGYAVFFGERFHFEGFFALALLAARGTQILVDRWQVPRRAVVFVLLMLAALQIGQLASAVKVISTKGEPYRKIRAAVEVANIGGLIFLQNSPGFVAKHFNLNAADWRHASRIFLVDADPSRRSEWGCRFGFTKWFVASYDARSRLAVLNPGGSTCPINTEP